MMEWLGMYKQSSSMMEWLQCSRRTMYQTKCFFFWILIIHFLTSFVLVWLWLTPTIIAVPDY